MIFYPSQWADLGKLLDIMQQLFDMPKESMHLDVTVAGISIKGKSLDSENNLQHSTFNIQHSTFNMSQSSLIPLFEWLQSLCLEAAHSLAADRCSSAAWNHRHAEYTALCWSRAFFRNIIFSHPRILA